MDPSHPAARERAASEVDARFTRAGTRTILMSAHADVYAAAAAIERGVDQLIVKPFELELLSPFSQWILTLPEKADRPDIRKFRNWLVAQADAEGLQRFE